MHPVFAGRSARSFINSKPASTPRHPTRYRRSISLEVTTQRRPRPHVATVLASLLRPMLASKLALPSSYLLASTDDVERSDDREEGAARGAEAGPHSRADSPGPRPSALSGGNGSRKKAAAMRSAKNAHRGGCDIERRVGRQATKGLPIRPCSARFLANCRLAATPSTATCSTPEGESSASRQRIARLQTWMTQDFGLRALIRSIDAPGSPAGPLLHEQQAGR